MPQVDLGKIGFLWRDVYDSTATYDLYDVVVDSANRKLYMSLKPNNIGNPLTDTTSWALLIDGGVMSDIIKSNNDPTITENLPVGTVWVNQTSGEIFVCVDDTTDNNVWQGQLGTFIAPTVADNIDIFGDGSGVALYKLDGDVADAGGVYDGQPVGAQTDLIFATDVAKPSFSKSLKIVGTQNQAFIIPQNTDLQIKSMSLWVKRISSETSTNAYLLDARNRGGNAYFIWNKGITSANVSRYLVNGQEVALDDTYKDQWIHLYIEFSSIQNGMVIGFAYSLSGNYDFGGYVDQIRLFNRALTNDEVQQLYNEK